MEVRSCAIFAASDCVISSSLRSSLRAHLASSMTASPKFPSPPSFGRSSLLKPLFCLNSPFVTVSITPPLAESLPPSCSLSLLISLLRSVIRLTYSEMWWLTLSCDERSESRNGLGWGMGMIVVIREEACLVGKYDCAWLLFSTLTFSARRFAPHLISPRSSSRSS